MLGCLLLSTARVALSATGIEQTCVSSRDPAAEERCTRQKKKRGGLSNNVSTVGTAVPIQPWNLSGHVHRRHVLCT